MFTITRKYINKLNLNYKK